MGTEVITADTVEKLRDDFFLLMKNANVVKDHETALQFRAVSKRYARRFEDVVYKGIVKKLEEEDKSSWWARRIREDCWGLVINIRVPVDQVMDGEDDGKWYNTPEYLFAKYERAREAWVTKVKREARKAWAILRSWVEEMSRKEADTTVPTPSEMAMDVEGFKVVVTGDSYREGQYLDNVRASLRLLRERAGKVFPQLLRFPWHINMEFSESLGSGIAADYDIHGQKINLSVWVMSDTNPQHGAKTIAHELGHHVYQTFLSDSDREFWSFAIKGDYGDVSLRDVLDAWPTTGRNSIYWIDGSPLAESDPFLYLQIYTFLHPPVGESAVNSREDLEALVESGVESVRLPSHPITVYATKNPEEAFCEALGNLVGYGPRTVHPEVLRWLRRILPALRVASSRPDPVAHRVMAAWLKRQAASGKSRWPDRRG